MFLTCEHTNASSLAVNVTSACNKSCFCDNVAYSPVCFVETGTTFFSPCHAACSHWDSEQKIYSGCTCGSELLVDFGNVSSILIESRFEDNATDETKRQMRKRIEDNFLDNIMTPGTYSNHNIEFPYILKIRF